MGITLEEKQADRWLAEATGSTVTSETPALMQSALDNIGNTPLIRCQAIEKEYGLECELYAKCEFFNAGGSVKDRIAKRMVLDAEASGRLKKGDTIIEVRRATRVLRHGEGCEETRGTNVLARNRAASSCRLNIM